MRRRGFTLLEVIVSLVVLTAGLVTIMEAFTVGLKASAAAERRTVATMLLQDKMEEIKKESQLAVGSDQGDFGDNFADYKWQADLSETSIAGLLHVAVTVSWSEGRRTNELALVTLVRQEQTSGDQSQASGPTAQPTSPLPGGLTP